MHKGCECDAFKEQPGGQQQRATPGTHSTTCGKGGGDGAGQSKKGGETLRWSQKLKHSLMWGITHVEKHLTRRASTLPRLTRSYLQSTLPIYAYDSGAAAKPRLERIAGEER